MISKAKFSNITKENKGPRLRKVLSWLITRQKSQWPNWVFNTHVPKPPSVVREDQIAITFINHATSLIQFKGINCLTDPVWSHRVSPFKFMGPKRVRAPGMSFNQLPKIDIVLISHNHYDHMDIVTLRRLEKKFKPFFIVPLGNQAFLKKKGLSNVLEMNWWEEFTFNDMTIHFVPAQHFSGRGFFDHYKTLWGGFVILQNQQKLFFAGDTGYATHFKLIFDKFGAMDISLLPIGSYDPAHLMGHVHMNPEEAVNAHLDLHSKLSIPIHFGTFQLTDEPLEEPKIKLIEALNHKKIAKGTFRILSEGETYIHENKYA